MGCLNKARGAVLYQRHKGEQFIKAAQMGLAHPEAERRALEERLGQLEAENAVLQDGRESSKSCAWRIVRHLPN